MASEKDKRNHTGQMPSDIPSKELINPPKRKSSRKKREPKTDFNTTAKMPNLGNRSDIGR